MRFEADPAKAAANLAKHGVSFETVAGFDFASAIIEASTSGEGPRLVALGLIGNRVHALVYSVETALRIISLRKANKREALRWTSEQ